jgi:hypothetical protein
MKLSTFLSISLAFCAAIAECSVVHSSRSRKATLGQEIIGPIDYDCPENGVFPDLESCERYIACWDGHADLWRCTDEMLFDLVYNGCNYAEYTHCDSRPRPTNVPSTLAPTSPTTPTTTSNVTTTTTPRPPEDFECPGDGVFAHEERCEYYWQCWAGKAELIHCQDDLLFDRRYLGCNFPDLTDCDHRTRPGTNPTTRPTTTQAPTSTTKEPETTTQYTGPTETTTPPPTTTHNPNATTSVSEEPTIGTTTTKKPGEFQCPDEDGDYPDPDDCSKYFTCVSGIAYHQQCPDGLFFDPITRRCEWEVDCQDRPTVYF